MARKGVSRDECDMGIRSDNPSVPNNISRRKFLNTAGRACAMPGLLQLFGESSRVAQASSTSAATNGDEFTPLPPNSIQFTGYFDNDIRNSIVHWNKGVVPYSDFVQMFRTGRKQFALGEMWGKAVRSGSMLYRYTQDPELKRILDGTVADLLTTKRTNGSISCVDISMQPDGPGGDLWERTYVLLGLDCYYENVHRDPAVLQAMIDEGDVSISQIGPPPKTRIIDQGWSSNHIESSTILEPIMRLYCLTGYQRYLDFARYIVEEGGAKGYDLIQQAYDDVAPVNIGGPYPKAYEMMSLFEGLVEYHRATGDRRSKTAVLNLFRNIRSREITIVGNGGGDQPYHPTVLGEAWDNTALEQTNPKIQRMMETCAGVTWLKLCSQIVRLTGNPAAVDEIEKYAYNGLLGAMKPTGDGFSYVNLLNGRKTNDTGWGWKFGQLHVTCCNLNGPMGLAYLPFVAVMNSKVGPVLNLYNAGNVRIQTPGGGTAELTIHTDYPKSGLIIVKVVPSVPEKFAIRMRIPGWSTVTELKVNGAATHEVPGSYAVIDRKWSPGDSIELSLDMRCKLLDAPRGSNRAGDRFQALVRGPIVLSRDENLDPAYDESIEIVSENGVVEVTPVAPTVSSTRMQFTVPIKGGSIQMVDYSSANSWNGRQICTWLPMSGNEKVLHEASPLSTSRASSVNIGLTPTLPPPRVW